jgi:hypothetical protein
MRGDLGAKPITEAAGEEMTYSKPQSAIGHKNGNKGRNEARKDSIAANKGS